MSEKVKYPKAIIGAFIFNDKNELFMICQPKWHNKYGNVGGKIESGESFEQAIKREVKEETNMDVDNMEFIGVFNGNKVNDSYKKSDNHLIFIDYIVTVKSVDKIKLNDEATECKWKKLDEWMKMKEDDFVPYIFEVFKKLKEKQIGFEGMYKRALADYQNLLKQSAKDREEFVKYANEQLILEIIPVYNNLKTSLEHVDETVLKNGWLEGIKYVTKQFKDVLESVGVEEIKTKGKNFNHHTMEALEGKGKKVKKEVVPGYMLKGKVIVPAKVILE